MAGGNKRLTKQHRWSCNQNVSIKNNTADDDDKMILLVKFHVGGACFTACQPHKNTTVNKTMNLRLCGAYKAKVIVHSM